jgi:hypothetical protein
VTSMTSNIVPEPLVLAPKEPPDKRVCLTIVRLAYHLLPHSHSLPASASSPSSFPLSLLEIHHQSLIKNVIRIISQSWCRLFMCRNHSLACVHWLLDQPMCYECNRLLFGDSGHECCVVGSYIDDPSVSSTSIYQISGLYNSRIRLLTEALSIMQLVIYAPPGSGKSILRSSLDDAVEVDDYLQDHCSLSSLQSSSLVFTNLIEVYSAHVTRGGIGLAVIPALPKWIERVTRGAPMCELSVHTHYRDALVASIPSASLVIISDLYLSEIIDLRLLEALKSRRLLRVEPSIT